MNITNNCFLMLQQQGILQEIPEKKNSGKGMVPEGAKDNQNSTKNDKKTKVSKKRAGGKKKM